MDENNITRSTVYMPKYLHKKAREAGINISKEVTIYLETVLFGDKVSDVHYQLEQVNERIKTIKIEETSLKARRKELEKIMKEHDAKQAAEQALYNRFMKHINNRLCNDAPFDFNLVCKHWQSNYFPGNGIETKNVKDIISLVKSDDFDFDKFRVLRNGGSL